MKRGTWVSGVVLLLAAGSGGWAYYKYGRAVAEFSQPTATSRKGEFLVIVSSRGELVADRSVLVNAPLNVPNLQLTWTAPPGSAVKEGDIILKFDISGANRQLQEKSAALKQAEASLDQAISNASTAEEQDKLELATLAHAVKRAEIEVSKQEIVSKLQAEQSKIELDLARSKLTVQAATLALNKASNASKVASLRAVADKARAEVEITKKRISRMEVTAPSAGVLSFLMNFSQGWMNAKPFKVGDNVWPGSSVAEIPDLQSLRFKGKLEEIERARVQGKQPARIYLDSFPETPFPGEVAAISPLTEQSYEWPPSRSFRVFASFQSVDGRLRPGMNGRTDVVVERIPDAVSVPAKAVFSRDGKPFVLTISREGSRAVSVEVIARNPDEVAVRGIEGGVRVALIDESGSKKKRGAS
ncbi:MAG TPA: efflux RND transporter periplasmic adaptor subunit [Bryobacteraceae bacterium]|nr:efflux RND transporter periplasmic adaptor subunit [Bryobacteraceae bacterium]